MIIQSTDYFRTIIATDNKNSQACNRNEDNQHCAHNRSIKNDANMHNALQIILEKREGTLR